MLLLELVVAVRARAAVAAVPAMAILKQITGMTTSMAKIMNRSTHWDNLVALQVEARVKEAIGDQADHRQVALKDLVGKDSVLGPHRRRVH